MPPSPPYRRPSAIDALGEGISHMRAKLFPFSFVGWFTLGFITLVETFGSGSATTGFRGRGRDSGSGDNPFEIFERFFGWINAHMIIFVGALMVLMLLSLLVVWLRSRMIFVYIDDVATGRFDLVRPWSEHSQRADSFFVLSLVVQGAAFIVLILIVALGVIFALWARAHEWPLSSIGLAAIPALFILALAILAAALLDMALRDFVAPLQVSRDIGAREAGSVFMSILSAYPGLLIGYALLKIVLWFLVGIAIAIVGCLTCCIGFIPLINQTLFQPIYYAERSWSLKLLAQLGDNVFVKLGPPQSPPPYENPSDALTGPIDLSAIDFETPPQE